MQSPTFPNAACSASEKPSSRAIRLVASTLLVAVAVLECGMAALMVAGHRSLASLLFLLCTLVLLASVAVGIRDVGSRALLVVQSAAAAGLLSLFWASGDRAHGPSITLGHSTYELTLTLAGLLFIAMLLARLLRPKPTEAACNCG